MSKDLEDMRRDLPDAIGLPPSDSKRRTVLNYLVRVPLQEL